MWYYYLIWTYTRLGKSIFAVYTLANNIHMYIVFNGFKWYHAINVFFLVFNNIYISCTIIILPIYIKLYYYTQWDAVNIILQIWLYEYFDKQQYYNYIASLSPRLKSRHSISTSRKRLKQPKIHQFWCVTNTGYFWIVQK